MPVSVPSAERNINFFIAHQCPQCGAPAELQETDRLVTCAFCKVKSYLVAHPYFRYCLPHHAPAGKALIYFPYWRFKGMLFSCLPSGIQNRFLDASQQAFTAPLFPASVGLRSQALALKFVSPETEGWFIKPNLPFKTVQGSFLSRFNGHSHSGPEILHQAHIGESLSLIYAPFYADRKIMDAVLNQPVSAELEAPFDPGQYPGGPAQWEIQFVPTLCPACGWDLKGSRDALVLHCTNCASMWQATQQGLSQVNVAHMSVSTANEVLYLPFWRIRARVSGILLDSYADLVKTANLPKIPQPGWERLPFYFWGPAFKVRPQSFLRLTHQATLSQPRERLVPEVPKGPMHPVNLPVSESVESLKLNMAGFIRPQKRVEASLPTIQVKAHRYLLVYLPFEVHPHDLVQPDFHIAINRNQLALAGNL